MFYQESGWESAFFYSIAFVRFEKTKQDKHPPHPTPDEQNPNKPTFL